MLQNQRRAVDYRLSKQAVHGFHAVVPFSRSFRSGSLSPVTWLDRIFDFIKVEQRRGNAAQSYDNKAVS